MGAGHAIGDGDELVAGVAREIIFKKYFKLFLLIFKLTRQLETLWAGLALVAIDNLKHPRNVALIGAERIGWRYWSHVQELFKLI